MSSEGFLNNIGEVGLKCPVFDGSCNRGFPLEVLVNFGDVLESIELSLCRLLPIEPEPPVEVRRGAGLDKGVGEGGVS